MFCEETLYSVALRHCPLIGDMIFRWLAGEPVRLRKCVKFQSQDFILFIASAKKKSHEIGKREHLLFAEKEIHFCENNNIKINIRHLGHLPEQQLTLLEALDKDTSLSLDEISQKLGVPSYRIPPDLLQLELSGCIRALSGRQYLVLWHLSIFENLLILS